MRVVVAGASSGLGAALAADFAGRGHEVVALSRRPAAAGRWVAADLSGEAGVAAAVAGIGAAPVDLLVHAAGIWEAAAFTPDYDFAASPAAEIRAVLDTNLLAPILLVQALLPQLAAALGRVIWIGSTSGLPGVGTPEVAYNASKAGMAAAGEALAVALRARGVTVSVLNPGDFGEGPGGIPMADLVAMVRLAAELSPQAVLASAVLQPGR